jgi:hypothetical protein
MDRPIGLELGQRRDVELGLVEPTRLHRDCSGKFADRRVERVDAHGAIRRGK